MTLTQAPAHRRETACRLTPDSLELLNALAEKLNVSRNSLIQRGVDLVIAEHEE